MNEQPQQPERQAPEQPEENAQPFYHANAAPGSSFSGYDLTQPHGAGEAAPAGPTPPNMPGGEVVYDWQASEYVHHVKTVGWFVGLAAGALGLLAIAYFLTHAWTFVILVVVMAIAMGVFATRPPRTLHYALTTTNIQIEQSTYHYSDFRAFGVLHDEDSFSIVLIPVKRFAPAVNLYFSEADGEKIVDALGARLPMEELHLDIVDHAVRWLRF